VTSDELLPAVESDLVAGHDPSVIRFTREPEIARDYDRFHQYNHLFETDTRFLEEVLPERCRVLDLGCGTGRHLAYLGKMGHEVTGVDLSAHMLAESARKLDRLGVRARLLRADICRVGEMAELAGEGFDAAICMFSTLGLVRGARRRRKALAGWRNVLRPGGLLVLHAHNVWHNLTDSWGRSWLAWNLFGSLLPGRKFGDKWMRGYRGMDLLYIHLFTLRDLRKLLRSAGFRIEREVLLNDPRTAPFEGRFAYFRANGFLVVARKP
jgi:SAM-dependent methyltransferase